MTIDTPGFAVHYGSLTLESGEKDYAAITQLGMSDFPTTLVYERGNLIHGWIGYNDQLLWGERSEALRGLLRSALERAATQRGLGPTDLVNPASTRGEARHAKGA